MDTSAARTPRRLLGFALRCRDDELVDLLLRTLDVLPSTSLAHRTYTRLADALGIAPAQ